MSAFLRRITCFTLGLALVGTTLAADDPPEKLAFFESRIRPVLFDRCQSCHNSFETAEGGLSVDSRAGLLNGGQSGPAVVPGKPTQSLLLQAIRHQLKGLEMPQGEDRLPQEIIADFERWIADGAVDPRDKPPSSDVTGGATWESEFQRRLQHWCFHPLAGELTDPADLENFKFVDRLIEARLRNESIPPAETADPLVLLRRLTFALTGLPPTQKQIAEFQADDSDRNWAHLVDRLLESPHFGEHWARHWMDWIRYTESHGSEGDPVIPSAWKYRDYLIRALNADIPYTQLLREHIAGDLLPDPRRDAELGLNESALATAHWRMVFHGFAPTDALDEKVRFTDDQINVFSQAFLGLTVSCARCHNHKFDPISQRDYYALFGILGSCRPGILDLNPPAKQLLHQDRLRELKPAIREELAQLWTDSLSELPERLVKSGSPTELITQAKEVQHPLHLLNLLHEALVSQPDTPCVELWQARLRDFPRPPFVAKDREVPGLIQAWDFTGGLPEDWFREGNGLVHHSAAEGDLVIAPDGTGSVAGVLPAGVFTHSLSTKHRGVLASSRIALEQECDLWLFVAGDGGSQARYAVQNYPRNGTVYPVRDLHGGDWHWLKFDLSYWTGDDIHIEVTTAADAPVLTKDVERSWFGIRRAELRRKDAPHPGNPRQEVNAHLQARLQAGRPESFDAAVTLWVSEIQQVLLRWQLGNSIAGDALILDACLKANLIPSQIPEQSRLQQLVTEYRRLEAEIPVPQRAPGLWEADALDQPLFVRGNHRQAANPVPRRFLEAFDPTPLETRQSGRLELAMSLTAADNPLVPRVIVNRIWHHLFGEGLVRTPDNFGHLGETPSHPELLDLLALKFQREGHSIKSLIRGLVLTRVWQRSSTASPAALDKDPENRLLSHAHVRPLEAESLRDALLLISGRLNPVLYGPPAGFDTRHPRRSVYTTNHRNSMNPFLETFNAPVPFATKGRRDATNVPAQSLTLLNDPFVIECARMTAERVMTLPEESRVGTLFEWSFGRPPRETEALASRKLVNDLADRYRQLLEQRQNLENQLAQLSKDREGILKPVRERMLNVRGTENSAVATPVAPLAAWDFSRGIEEILSGKPSQLHGTARLEHGALILDGRGHLSSPPLPHPFKEKTLEAWVQLTHLDQRGGGMISHQDLQGNVFDAIVYGEQHPGRWLAGSNFFRRTRDLKGPEEQEALNRPIHLAMTYQADGTIACYRDGTPYGAPYQSEGLAGFEAEQSQILLGLRHGSPGGNRMLSGRIFAARIYGRALTSEEIAASASGNARFLSDRELLEACSAADRVRLDQMARDIATVQEQKRSLPERTDDVQIWADLSHALWNLKEFRFIK